MHVPQPLTVDERAELLARRRSHPALPILSTAPATPALREALAGAQPVPTYAVWEVTLACDLACRHCGSRAGHARPEELSTTECLDVVEQLADLGVREVTLIGGEAYLRDDWTQLIRASRARGMRTSMTTGGRGFTAERAAAAREAGLSAVSVSIDGLEATHDRLRGVSGSHRAALAALGHARAVGLPYTVNTQINRLSAPEIPAVADLLVAEGVRAWQIQLTVAMGRAADEPEVLLQPYDLLELFPLLAKLKERCDELKVRMWPGNNLGYFGPYESVLRGQMPRGHMYSCGAGRSTLGIEADGSIKGCPSLPTEAWVGGNIRDHSLKDIWERGGPLRYTRDRTVEDLWGYCRTCYYADECRAGCTWTGFVLFGKPGNNPYCHHRALEHQREGKRERVVKLEDAPGLPFDHGKFDVIVEPIPAVPTSAE
jgi:radical SAM protein with 4Fe4S-binding SPASM domain